MAMNLVPYSELQDRDVTFTVMRRLVSITPEGNRLKAGIGSDYKDTLTEKTYDQIVVNYGTMPNA